MSCLLLSTDIAFEIWLVKPNSERNQTGGGSASYTQGNQFGIGAANIGATSFNNVEVECIYRRKEDHVEIMDILHFMVDAQPQEPDQI